MKEPTELEQLYLEKRKIENKIRELKCGYNRFMEHGSVRVVEKDGCWETLLLTKQPYRRYETNEEAERAGRGWNNRMLIIDTFIDRWQRTFKENAKEDLMKRIKRAADDLHEMYKILQQEEQGK